MGYACTVIPGLLVHLLIDVGKSNVIANPYMLSSFFVLVMMMVLGGRMVPSRGLCMYNDAHSTFTTRSI